MSSNNQQILLDIDKAPVSLKATLPMQAAVTSFKYSELKATLWDTSLAQARLGHIATTEFFTTNTICTTEETSTTSTLFGLKHAVNFTSGSLLITQTFNRAQLSDYVYRFIPESREAFWMMQHAVKFNTPFSLGNVTLTPSLGVSHLMVQGTVFQDGFQTLNPDLSLTCGITHISDMSKLSLNTIATALYSKGTMVLSDHDWITNAGFNLRLQTPVVNIATGILNPFQSNSEIYVNIQANF